MVLSSSSSSTPSSSTKSSKSNSSSGGGNFIKRGFNEAFNTAKSALSSVASFITECHSSGIPFTVADKAMIESQETYKKYWEGGLHSKNNDSMKNNNNSSNRTSSVAVVAVGGGEEGSSSMMVMNHENNNSSSSSSINPKTALELKEYFDNKKKKQQQQQAEANAIEEEERHRHHHHKRRKLNPNTMTTTTQIINNNEDNQNQNNQNQKHKNLSFLEQTLVSIQEMLNEKRLINEENEIHTFAMKSPRQFIVSTVRSQLIDTLLTNHGNVNDPSFKASLDILASMYKSSQINACSSRSSIKKFLQGNWVVISRPTYKECLGTSPGGDFMYTLGRMSFDMFRPSHLKCSVQSTHNTFSLIKSNTSNKKKKKSNDDNEEKKNNDDNDSDDDSDDDNNNDNNNNNNNELPSFIPSSLKNEVQKSNSDSLLLCKYDIATSLTIEPDDDEDDDDEDDNDDDDNKPSAKGGGTTTNRQRRRRRRRRQRALMLVKGYMLPDPNKTNRFTVWFTSGRLAPAVLSSSDNDNDNNNNDTNSNDDDNYGNLDTWKELFSNNSNSSENNQNHHHHQNHQQPTTIIKTRTATWSEQARGMAARLLLGADLPNGMNMNDNYALSYTLHRPIGGHGQTYVDVLYLDRDILITKGNRGTIYVMATSAVSQRYCEIENVNVM